MPVPRTFLPYGDVWVDCDVCGFSYPLSHMKRNHKTKKLVDIKCDDTLSHSDYTEVFTLPADNVTISPQPVPDQGAAGGPLGAGEGGAGTGESGEGAGG